MEPPNEFYIWQPHDSSKNLDQRVWSRFEVAVFAGRLIWKERARCRVCGRLVGWSGSSGNLKRHLTRNHPDLMDPMGGETGGKIDELVSQRTFEEEFGGRILRAIGAGNSPVKMYGKLYINGNLIRKRRGNYLWDYFFQPCLPDGTPYGRKYVTCVLCGRDISWGGKGLAPLRKHIHRFHFADESGKRESVEHVVKMFGEGVL